MASNKASLTGRQAWEVEGGLTDERVATRGGENASSLGGQSADLGSEHATHKQKHERERETGSWRGERDKAATPRTRTAPNRRRVEPAAWRLRARAASSEPCTLSDCSLSASAYLKCLYRPPPSLLGSIDTPNRVKHERLRQFRRDLHARCVAKQTPSSAQGGRAAL